MLAKTLLDEMRRSDKARYDNFREDHEPPYHKAHAERISAFDELERALKIAAALPGLIAYVDEMGIGGLEEDWMLGWAAAKNEFTEKTK
jgi:hypothetical protein